MDGAWQGGSTFSETTGIGLEKIGGRQKPQHVVVLERGGSRTQHEQRTESEELQKNSAVQPRPGRSINNKQQGMREQRACNKKEEGIGNYAQGMIAQSIVGMTAVPYRTVNTHILVAYLHDLRSLFGVVSDTIAGITPMSNYAFNHMPGYRPRAQRLAK
jgi:hypothetical protein